MRNAANLVAEISYENALQELLNLETLSLQEPAHIMDIAAFFRHSHREVRYAAAAVALGYLGNEAKTRAQVCQITLQQIIILLRDHDASVRTTALKVLGEMGETTKMYIPQTVARRITSCLHDPESSVRAAAVETLGKLSEIAKKFLPEMAECLADKEPSVRAAAVWAFGNLGRLARDYIATLRVCLHDEDESVRNVARDAMASLFEFLR